MAKKFKIKNTIILILLCTSIGFALAYFFFISPLKDSKPAEVLYPSNVSKKIITKDVLINDIHEKQELITLEVDLSEKMSIDDSWGSFPIFKKITNINYAGTGTYVLSLADIKPDNISMTGKDITIKIPEPTAKSVNIDKDKTTFEPTENGLLRFGDTKITPAENAELESAVQEKMLLKMQEPELLNKAKESSTKAVEDFLKSTLSDKVYNQYIIKIIYE